MHPLLRQLLATARERSLFPSPGLAVVAVSGGPDSVALLHALNELAPVLQIELLVAHLDHGLRPQEGAHDAAAVGEQAGRLGLPVEIGIRNTVPARGVSIEETARDLRYGFLNEIAARHRARYLAIGHTADDQAETLLMRLLRGAGPRGLRAMTPIASRAGVAVVRPLLESSRDLIRSYLTDRQLSIRFDRTNRDLRLERNRIRNVLMPLLASEFNPSVVESFGRTAEIMNEVDEHLTAAAETALTSDVLAPSVPPALGPGRPRLGGADGKPSSWTGGGDGVDPPHLELDIRRFSTYDRILQRTMIRQAILRLGHDLRGIGFDHIDALLGLASGGRRGQRVELPGGALGLREGDRLTLWAADPGEAMAIPFTPLPLTGEVPLPEVGVVVRVELIKVSEIAADARLNGRDRSAGDDPGREVFDRDRIQLPLAIRSRRAGDRILPRGAAAEKKVKDLLIGARVPRRLRPAIPLLVDGAGGPGERILWVAGLRRSAQAAVGKDTSQVLEVRLSAWKP
jgi:tRNA(Ile)-lysidine synthase